MELEETNIDQGARSKGVLSFYRRILHTSNMIIAGGDEVEKLTLKERLATQNRGCLFQERHFYSSKKQESWDARP